MAKNKFFKGDLVSGKKWNGEHFIGVYEYEYDCGDHCITDGQKEYCIKHNDCHKANDEEAEIIRETILKTIKDKNKKKNTKKKIIEDDLETILTEEIEQEE